MSKYTIKRDKQPFGRHPKRKACDKNKNNNTAFDDENKIALAETDFGSYYNHSE